MSFIREKEIPIGSGKYYEYEVRTYRDHGKVKQKQIYVGVAGTARRRNRR